jgi:hypothetical protein
MNERTGTVRRRGVLPAAVVFAVVTFAALVIGLGPSPGAGTRAAEPSGAAVPGPAAGAGNAEADFRPLFDGKSFAGWRVNENTPKSWKIEDGLLKLLGGSSHLFTNDNFDDFVVRIEWRAVNKGYNSGFFVRGRQIQLAQGGAGMLFGSDRAKAVPKLHRPPGEWNEWEVTAIGPRLSLKVNGTGAWEIDDFKPPRGPLGIEAEGHAIDFRNLRIKSLRK